MAGSFNAGRNAGSSASQDQESQSQDRPTFDRPSTSAGRGAGQESSADRVRTRAYELFESRTVRGEDGDAITDWLRAETELGAVQTDESDRLMTADTPASTDEEFFSDQEKSGRNETEPGSGFIGYAGGSSGYRSSPESMPEASGTSRNTERRSRF